MRFVVCAGNYSNPQRLTLFLESISRTRGIDMSDVHIVNTSVHRQNFDNLANHYGCQITSMGIEGPVLPAKQMKLRVDLMNFVCDDSTLFCNFDDDYQFNPYWMKFASMVFEAEESVHYLTLLRSCPGHGYVHPDHIGKKFKIGKFNFAWTKSAMGGSFIVRWCVFKEHMKTFFETYGEGGQFDNDIWSVIDKYYRKPYNMCMSMDFSLYQHCNLISQYGHDSHHAYGMDYDPIVNPFEVPISSF
jgi:hypothetical protein